MRLVVLISGRGSNLKAIIDNLPEAKIEAIISNNPNAVGLKYAKLVNAETHIIDHQSYKTREDFDKVLQKTIVKYQPDLIILAGFMRILSDNFVQYFKGKLINIHPSLLPKYKGTNTHERAIKAGEKFHGATVHFVSDILDSGVIIQQSKISIKPDDTPDTLAKRVLKVEHRLYSEAIRKISQN